MATEPSLERWQAATLGRPITHLEHVRFTWELVRRHGPVEGGRRVVEATRRNCVALDAVERFDEALTRRWVDAVADALGRGEAGSFEAFLERHPELLRSDLLGPPAWQRRGALGRLPEEHTERLTPARLEGGGTLEAASTETARSYVLHVTLQDGEELTAGVGNEQEARAGLSGLHALLASEPFVVLGDDAIVRSDDVRYVQLRESGDDDDGFLDTMRSKLGGDRGGMSSDNTEETEVRPASARRGAPERRGGGGTGWADEWIGYGRRPWAETKPFFLTSEFLGALAMIAAVLIAAAVDDGLGATRAWTLAAGIAAAYILSRGFAKSGTRDPNPSRGARE